MAERLLELVPHRGEVERGRVSVCFHCYYTETYQTNMHSYTQIDFWRRCAFPTYKHWNIAYTRKGIWNIRRTRALRLLTAALAIFSVYRIRRSGLGIQDFKTMFRQMVQGALANMVQSGTYLRKQALAITAL